MIRQVNKPFQSCLTLIYGDNFDVVVFRNDGGGSAATINGWVAEKTNNMITEIVPASAIDALTQLILVNAVYFKGDWKNKFDAKRTKNQDFHVSPKETLKVKMMFMEEDFHFGVNRNLKCQAIELPYAGDTLSMFILLPDRTTTLSQLEGKLTSDDLVNIRRKFNMSSEEVKVWLPKFRLDEQLSLAESLGGMGMKDLFVDGVADLSGVDGTHQLYVSSVLHRAVVDVNEEGTESAAATALTMVTMCARFEECIFRADHPFLFFIEHKPTRSIVFLGRLVKPLPA